MDPEVATLPPYTSSSSEAQLYASYGQDPHKGGMQPVNVQSNATVVVIQPDNSPIRDDLLWSIFNTIYMNACCLGFTALSYSVKSRDRKLFGDRSGAMFYGTKARKFNIAATVITISIIFIYMIVFFTRR